MGVPRHDAEARRIAVLRNWEFFRAPLGAIVCMHRDLDFVDALGVGMFLQTFMLALTARGVGSCVQVSIAGYPDVIREQLGIGEDMRILCGVSIGYADPDFPANALARAAQSARAQRDVRRKLNVAGTSDTDGSPRSVEFMSTLTDPKVASALDRMYAESTRADVRAAQRRQPIRHARRRTPPLRSGRMP